MFLHITSRIPNRKDDGMLRKVGGRGFPTLLAMSSKGETMAKPRRRSLQAFEDAMDEAAELEGEIKPTGSSIGEKDAAAHAMELLRKVKLGTLTDPAEDRAAYILARSALNEDQRKLVERALVMSELASAQVDGMQAQLGTPESERAMLTMLAAKEKLGGKWPIDGTMNRVLITLMRWAEHNKDPQLYKSFLGPFIEVRRKVYANQKSNEAFIQKFKDRLATMWKGQDKPVERRGIRRR